MEPPILVPTRAGEQEIQLSTMEIDSINVKNIIREVLMCDFVLENYIIYEQLNF